jgi:uncharacterized protein YndB with AHSA1/START domain
MISRDRNQQELPMRARPYLPVLVALAAGLGLGLALRGEEPASFAPQGFTFELEAHVPGRPEQVFDLFTGDVSPWWDHRYSEQPAKLVIEPRPGGAFIEIFDAAGNGAEHARVLVAERGKELVFRGPLGFGRMGVHLDFVHRVTFEADGDGTTVRVSVHGLGEMQEGWPATVRGVWQHFLIEQFQPYATGKLR